ncbi:MAG: hypothetical protein CM1200mP23_0980 [Nitrososphaerota archaeon]|nr:MAG: hypothetical protein CM1200mP23_0980 [Nitrososphaerota archaeon]
MSKLAVKTVVEQLRKGESKLKNKLLLKFKTLLHRLI